ncbi:MAG: amylo-alpha-1,6-glucosidase [Candidatus Nanohaloarchaea archaeon]
MYHLKKPAGKTGTVSNLDAFIHRGLDTGFSSKWMGVWKPPFKLLDYYAYKINGIWLDEESLDAVDYGDDITYYHETESLHVQEKISAPQGLPGVKSELMLQNNEDEKKAVHIVLEAGVDIREKNVDIPEQDYSVRRDSSKIEVESGKKLSITSDRELHNSGEAYVKQHFPGEKQECLVPGETGVMIELEPGEDKKVEFRFTSGEASDLVIEKQDNRVEGSQKRVFEASVRSMENLIYDREGLGIIAGHPWFQSYWARDTFWTLLGLIDAGYFREAEKILENFAERGLPGKINLGGKDEETGRNDTYPLYIIAADKLKRHHKISEKIEDGMEEAFSRLELDNGVVQHNPEGTWMDTLERPGAVDVQCLWLEAAEIMGEKEDKLEEGLEKFENNHIKDHLGEEPSHTVNPAVGLMFEQFDEKYLSKINAEFSSLYGARTRSFTDPGYESSGYHTGSTWGLTSCWAAAANLRNGKTTQGLNFIEKFSGFLDRNQPGALPELVDSETGESLGCVEQAWSAGMTVHVIDSYLFGIEIDKEKIKIDPAPAYTGERHGKRVGDNYIDIKVEDGKAEILNDPGLDREVLT